MRSFATVDTLERNQVRLILEHLTSETLRKSDNAQKAMCAELSARGLLRSGATVKRAVNISEEHALRFVEQAVDQTSAVAQDIDAFTLIVASLTAMLNGLSAHVEHAVRLATSSDGSRFDSVDGAAKERFADMRNRVLKQLEIHRFSFTKPTKGDLAAQHARIFGKSTPLGNEQSRKNPGGKPLAAHWDAMWAAIAVKLWSGELLPKSQADVKAAMLDWFNAAELEIGDTAVTQRARQLWQAMQDADG